MTLLFTESFDDGLYDQGKWDTISGTYALDTGKTGTNGLRLRDDSNVTLATQVTTGKSTIVVGFALNAQALPASGDHQILVGFDSSSSGNRHFALVVNSSGDMQVYAGSGGSSSPPGTNHDTASGAVTTDGYHYFELKIVIHDSTGSFELRRDGTTVASASNVDTRRGGATVERLEFAGCTDSATTGDQSIIDDIYVDDADFLGVVEVFAVFPTSDGDVTDFTPDTGSDNYARVDEVTPDDDTSYVESSGAANEVDVYGFDDLTGTEAILAVVARAYTKKTVTIGSSRHVIRRSASNEVGDSETVDTSYGFFSKIMEDDPHTSAAWTISNFNDTQFGVETLT